IENFIDLPEMQDPEKLAAMVLLRECLPPSYFLGSRLLFILGIKMIELSLTYGNNPHSSVGYIYYSLTLAFVAQDFETAYKFGSLALRLNDDKYQIKPYEALILNMWGGHTSHYTEHLDRSREHLMRGYYSGVENGAYQWAGYCAVNYLFMCFWGIDSLKEVSEKIDKITPGLKKVDPNMVQYYYAIKATIYNLIEPVEDWSVLDESIWPNAKELLNSCLEKNDLPTLFLEIVCKLSLANWYSDSEKAIDYANSAEKYLIGVTGLFINSAFHFHQCLALSVGYDYADGEKQAQYVEKIKSNLEKFKLWSKHCPSTYLHQRLLIEAELARITGNVLEAQDLYDQAIESARENKFLQNEALASELAAKFWLGKGKEKIAKVYMSEAHYGYQCWGAKRKVEDLEEKYPQLLPKSSGGKSITSTGRVSSSTSTSTQSGAALDLATVMKASQAISGEIVLDKLLTSLMRILMENAGAQVGSLILESQEKLLIEAQVSVDSEQVTVLQSINIENSEQLPLGVIQYVARTQEDVVLSDATNEGVFTREPYIVKKQPKSVLCIPIINQGKLIGIIYLENNRTAGAFTPDRLEVLKILCSQTAISIENATLYQNLEDKVNERTAQLAQANGEISTLNQKLKAENVRMSAELDIVKQLQQMVLPKQSELEAIEGLEIAGFMEPADEVGGDYYDVLQQDGQVKISIGDVTGHGLESGVLMIMAQTAVRTLHKMNETDPVKFLDIINQTLYDNLQRINSAKNMTLAILDYAGGVMKLSGQHEEVIVVRADGTLECVDTMDLGFPIGLVEEIADFITQTEVQLNPGDVVVLYTDGIPEAKNINKAQYGLERLWQVVVENRHRSAAEIREAVIADVRQYIGVQRVFDDITLVVMKQK
ncbi:SpoIIE family protein phosphatase, partial [Microcoleus sp. LAD1_D3]|uniref:SpoIIE family protein phosphatase n=1 Tax=Microcoleus sp. LAD1_D3 TaxID=2819365 RepID=UPI002FD7668F